MDWDRDFAIAIALASVLFLAAVVGSVVYDDFAGPPEVDAYSASVGGDGVDCVRFPNSSDSSTYDGHGDAAVEFAISDSNVSHVNVFSSGGGYVGQARVPAVGAEFTEDFWVSEGEYRLVAVESGGLVVGESSLDVTSETVSIENVDSVERGGDCG